MAMLLGRLCTGLEQLDPVMVTVNAQSLPRTLAIFTDHVPLLHVVAGKASFLLKSLPALLALELALP